MWLSCDNVFHCCSVAAVPHDLAIHVHMLIGCYVLLIFQLSMNIINCQLHAISGTRQMTICSWACFVLQLKHIRAIKLHAYVMVTDLIKSECSIDNCECDPLELARNGHQ